MSAQEGLHAQIHRALFEPDSLNLRDAEKLFARLEELLDEVERLRGERPDVVAWLREQRTYGTDELLGQGFATVCGILSDGIERGEHRREEER